MSALTDADFAPPTALDLPRSTVELSDGTDEAANKEPEIGEDGVPLLRTFAAENEDMRVEALHLVADSVAQQRNLASSALIYHPVTLGLLVVAFGVTRQWFSDGHNVEYIKVFTTFLGIAMAFLAGIRLLCGPYIFEAEKVGTWAWLDKGRSVEEEEETGSHVLGDVDEVLLSKFGPDHIGVIIFRGVQPAPSRASPTGNKKVRRTQEPSKQTRMVIRAWTVRQKFRRKEVGSALMEEAIKVGKEKGWLVGGIEIAEDHANSKRILPTILNGALDRYDKIAQQTLDKKISEFEASQEKGRKKR